MFGSCVDIVMGQSPKGEFVNEVGNGLPLLNGPTEFGPSHPFPTQFTDKGVRFAEPGDLLFCVRGSTTGRMNWADQRYAIGRGIAAIRHSSDKRLQPLVRGLIESQLPTLLAAATGSTFPNVTGKMIASLSYSELSQAEQLEAAVTLGQIDDKIELNRRMNETLEEMARALFRDWFVDFGPTRRQIAGAIDPAAIMGHAFPPEKAATLAPQFPAKLNDDGLPEGWAQVSAKELATKVQNGGTPSRKNAAYWDNGNIPWLTSGEVRQAFITYTENFITQSGLDGSSAKWVPAGSTVIALYGATAGQVSFTLTKVTTNQAICALLPKDGFRYFLLLAMRSRVADLADSAVGSAQQNISKKIVEDVQLVVPDSKLASQFDGIVAPLFQKIENSLRENQTLAEMRDLLLPKLMSGEIRLKDAEVVQLSEISKPTPDFATDLLGDQFLSPEQGEERDAVIVAATVKALQKDDLLVGNVRVMKGVYLLKRKKALSLAEFQREAAGPYDRALNHEIRGYARERSWIRETKRISVQGSRIPGNQPASKYSEVEPLIEKYDLSDAVDWLAQHFKGASKEWMECVATVDVAVQELTRKGLDVTVANIKADIASDPAWKPKLSKDHFTDIEIRRAVKKLEEIF